MLFAWQQLVGIVGIMLESDTWHSTAPYLSICLLPSCLFFIFQFSFFLSSFVYFFCVISLWNINKYLKWMCWWSSRQCRNVLLFAVVCLMAKWGKLLRLFFSIVIWLVESLFFAKNLWKTFGRLVKDTKPQNCHMQKAPFCQQSVYELVRKSIKLRKFTTEVLTIAKEKL